MPPPADDPHTDQPAAVPGHASSANTPPGVDCARPRQAVAAADATGMDVLARGRATLLERLWLGFRYFAVRVVAQIRELRSGELNLSWVTDSLAVGGAFAPRDVRRLREAGVSAVLDLRGEASDDAALLAQHGIAFLHLPTPDTYPPSPEHFARGVAWVLEQQAAGRRVFVH